MTQLLQQAVGQRMAKQLYLTCKPLLAQDALRCGLVNEVVPPAELVPRALQIAQDICAVNRDMMMKIKDAIEKRNETTLEGALRHEKENFVQFLKDVKMF